MNFILKICLPISFIYHSGCMNATMLPYQLKPYLLLSPYRCAYRYLAVGRNYEGGGSILKKSVPNEIISSVGIGPITKC